MNKTLLKLTIGTLIASSTLVACNKSGGSSKKGSGANLTAQSLICTPEISTLLGRINSVRNNSYGSVPQNNGINNNLNNMNAMNNRNTMNMNSNIMDINSDCVQLEQRTPNMPACTNQNVLPNALVDLNAVKAYCKSITTGTATNGGINNNNVKNLKPTKSEVDQLAVTIDEDSVGQIELSIVDGSRLKGLRTRYSGWVDTDGLFIPVTACSVKSFLPENGKINPATDGKLMLSDFSFDQANKDIKFLWLIPVGTEIVSKFRMDFTSDKNADIGLTFNCEYKVTRSMAESLGGVPDVSQGMMNYVFRNILKFSVVK